MSSSATVNVRQSGTSNRDRHPRKKPPYKEEEACGAEAGDSGDFLFKPISSQQMSRARQETAFGSYRTFSYSPIAPYATAHLLADVYR